MFAETALVAGSRIGRYFGLVSAIPSALFIFFIYGLVSSGAWSGNPQLDAAIEALGNIDLADVALLLVLTLALGLVLHPLQFALIQVLEGYWGTNLVARWLAVLRIRHHRARAMHLEDVYATSTSFLDNVGDDTHDTLNSKQGAPYVPALVDEQTHGRARQSYPEEFKRVMPTRLGNVLRRFEDEAGSQYKLDAITVGPHLALVAEPSRGAYLQDAREQLDLAVRLCALSLLAAFIAFAFLVTDGLWLLVAAVPYGLAYVFYRGAIVAAGNYMTTLSALIDLDRFRLYSQLHLRMPRDTNAERLQNEKLMELLSFKSTTSLPYVADISDSESR